MLTPGRSVLSAGTEGSRGRCVRSERAGSCRPSPRVNQRRVWIGPLPSAGHIHRPEAASTPAAGAGQYVPAVFLLHPGAQEPPPLPPPRGFLMSRRYRGPEDTGGSLPHGSGPVGSPQAGPPPSLSPAPAHTRASGLGRGQFGGAGFPRGTPGGTLPGHVIRPSSPLSRGSAQPCACAQHNTRLPSPLLRLLPSRGDGSNPRPPSVSAEDAGGPLSCPCSATYGPPLAQRVPVFRKCNVWGD